MLDKNSLIFQNDDFLVVYKSEGQEFHGECGIVTQARKLFGHCLGVHRLDRDTSGLLLLAKNKETQSELSRLFSEKLVQKTYIAISDKKPKKKQGLIKGDMAKSRNGSYKLTRTSENPSITRFRSYGLADTRLSILRPATGKTHQLRVVMKSLASPIIGDKRYGGSESDRMYLHAYSIEFKYKNQTFIFEELPRSGDLFLEHSVEIAEHIKKGPI